MNRNIREESEAIERETLSPFGTLSENSKGRLRVEEPCELRTIFQRDRDRIIHRNLFES